MKPDLITVLTRSEALRLVLFMITTIISGESSADHQFPLKKKTLRMVPRLVNTEHIY